MIRENLRERDNFKALLNEVQASEFDVPPTTAPWSIVEGHLNGVPMADPHAPRYRFSRVLEKHAEQGLAEYRRQRVQCTR